MNENHRAYDYMNAISFSKGNFQDQKKIYQQWKHLTDHYYLRLYTVQITKHDETNLL